MTTDSPSNPRETAPATRDTHAAEIHLTTVTPVFKLIFLSVLAITLCALALNVILVVCIDSPNDQAKSLIDTCSTIVKTGFGAIVGLVGGKAV